MSQWIGSQEVGLAPGQTAGEVAGKTVVRPAGSNVSEAYIPGVGSTSIMIEGGAIAGRGGVGVGETTNIRRDQYGNVIGIRQSSPSGETIFERRPTPGGGYLESGLPLSIQPRYAAIEQTRAEIPMYRAMATPPQLVAVPSPFQVGFVGQGGQFSAFDLRSQQQYPSTPIDYSRTHVSELYSYPLYSGASFVSRGLQAGLEFGVDVQPLPKEIKEAQKGFGSMFTGIPEFVASGLAGWEYAAREPKVFKEGLVPSIKMFGAGLTEQATTRPYYTVGQLGGLAYGMRGMFKGGIKEVKPPSTEPSIVTKMFGARQIPTEGARLSEFKAAITPTYQKMFGVPEGRPPSATMAQFKEGITPTYSKMFGQRQIPATGANVPEIKTAITPSFQKMFGARRTAIKGASIEDFKSSITPTYRKMFGATQTGKITEAARKTTWNLEPTPEYIQGKFIEYNIFKGGDIQQLSKYLKTTPTTPIFPRQIQPMGLQRITLMPKQISTETPLKGLKIVEPSTSKVPSGTEIKTKTGMVLIQKQKLVPKVEVIQVQKAETKTSLKTRMGIKMMAIPRMQSSTKAMSLTVQRQKPEYAVSIVPIQKQKIISIAEQKSVSKAISASSILSVQATKATTQQLSRGLTEQMPAQIPKTIQISRVIETPLVKQIQRPKTPLVDVFPPRRKRKGKRKVSKFPEITRVAAPRQVMKGFRL